MTSPDSRGGSETICRQGEGRTPSRIFMIPGADGYLVAMEPIRTEWEGEVSQRDGSHSQE